MKCVFDPISLQLFANSRKDLRVINFRTGKTSKILSLTESLEDEVSYLKEFENLQRLIFGNQKGQLKIVSAKDGSTINDLAAHASEISFVCFDQVNSLIISTGFDGNLRIL